jgi:hypothetical protein
MSHCIKVVEMSDGMSLVTSLSNVLGSDLVERKKPKNSHIRFFTYSLKATAWNIRNLTFKYIHNHYFTCFGTIFQYHPVVLSEHR